MQLCWAQRRSVPNRPPAPLPWLLLPPLAVPQQVPGCDEWVQCDRCQLWRLVPQDWAQAVRDDTRQEWLCEYAQVCGRAPHAAPPDTARPPLASVCMACSNAGSPGVHFHAIGLRSKWMGRQRHSGLHLVRILVDWVRTVLCFNRATFVAVGCRDPATP